MSDAGLIAFIDRHGAKAATYYIRKGAGPCVVLVHGVGMQAAVWQKQIDALSRHYDVIAYDMLGHGGSTLPPSDAVLGDFAIQLRAVLDHFGIERAAVIGHSMGALVALEFALAFPQRANAVVAMNAVFCRTREQKLAIAQRVKALETGLEAAHSSQAIGRWFGDPVPASLRQDAQEVRDFLDAVDPLGYRRAYKLFANSDEAHRERLQNLQSPALFMTGELDPNSTPEMSQAMATLAPQGRAEIVPGERHMISLTATDDVNRRLLGFLAASVKAVADPRAFRRALGSFLTGVTIVATTQEDGQPRGFTANSLTSVSLDPPLVSVCIAKTAASFPLFGAAEHFSINVLAENQMEISNIFASKAANKFEATGWRKGATGSPVIDGAAAWFDCRRYNIVEAGDHIILIGEVLSYADTAVNPLGYCRGAYVTFDLSVDKIAASGSATRVGAILERDRSILLVEKPDGEIDLPFGTRMGSAGEPASLLGFCQSLSLEVEVGFLFSVFEEPSRGPGAVSIYYRGKLMREPAPGTAARLVSFDDIPWDRLRHYATTSMLHRYIEERNTDVFGIYVGDDRSGKVHSLAAS
jgi:flavin reductase (DIM6/NTAB) family NADH-FMN oxidoreductase RutF/pimeloyl-ACP methyl ester carboxylesterase